MAIDINVPSQVKTYANLAAFPATGSLKTIFIAEDTNKTYRWTGSVYVEVSAAGASGITIGTTAITSGTVGRVLFEGTGNVVQESANLFWDNTNGRLGIGGTPSAFKLDIVGTSSANIIGIKVRNTSTNGYTEINCYNNTGGDNDRIYFGVGGTATGDVYQNRGYFISSLALEGITFTAGKTTTGDMRFFTGGNNERLRIFGNGNVLINTTTDAGYKLDVNGTAIIRDTLSISNQGRISWGGGFLNIFADSSNGLSLHTPFGRVLSCTQTTGNVLIGTTTDVASSLLTMQSTTKGFLPPRMTTTQKNAIATPATGLMVYDNVLNRPCFYDGATWITL